MGPKMRDMLVNLSTSLKDNVIVFGEIFGPGVQDLDYGQNVKAFRVFDISVNGEYMNWVAIKMWCDRFGILVVPVLYEGPFSLKKVEELTYGDTTFPGVRNKFKGREGVVVTPLVEQVSYNGRRMIVKSVSADYRDRKGATDIE
jgi:RNA ligase (TIGR02306 family)